MRVLMVEDDVKMAGLVRRGLEEDGHAADMASRGEDAVWMAQAHPYDVIVLDVMLPSIDKYRADVAHFLSWLGPREPVACRQHDIEDYLDEWHAAADRSRARGRFLGRATARRPVASVRTEQS
jgi:Response regulator receiver domain